MAKKGRPQKPYQTSWGGVIPGLAHDSDGRWRIIATGERFRETDERRAIARFRKWELDHAAPTAERIGRILQPKVDHANDFDRLVGGLCALEMFSEKLPPAERQNIKIEWDSSFLPVVSQDIQGELLWAWLREKLIADPAWVARKVGIPELASLARFNIPKPPIRIDEIRAAYRKYSPATEKAKNEALSPFEKLVRYCEAKTLDDLTDSQLTEWREVIVTKSNLKSSGTIGAYFGRVKAVLKLARHADLDVQQIDAALVRCAAKLYRPPNNVLDNPQPISPENYRQLLASVHLTDIRHIWRAMLLLGLNCALYMEDICGLEWKMFDLGKATFIARRKKRGNCLRVAVLWPETIEALRRIERTDSPFVFLSNRGTRYNKNTKINDFRDFCVKAGVTGVTWSHLRDGAYTAAALAKGIDAKFYRLLVGHKSDLEDKYVLANPSIVKPTCWAIHKAYAPFPEAVK